MSNFRDIVTNYTIGAISRSKVGFYAKRLAKETATRRLASVLMIGLLVLQFAVFIAPPKPSYASSPADLVAGGPFTRASIINTVWNNNPAGVQQVFLRLGITREKMQQSTTAQACKGQGWLSMGRNPDAGSTQWQPGIYIGPAESRWAQNCFNVMRGTSKVQDGQTGQWYEWGVILECGNIILKPTTPPQPQKEITCERLDTNNAGPVAVGTTIGYRGRATGRNVSPGELVGMSYAVYKPNGTPLGQVVDGPKRANGIPDDPNGSGRFTDPNFREFTFNEPGNYIVRLAVTYNLDGNQVIAGGSFVNSCAKTIQVQAPKTLVCKDLQMQNTTGIAPFTPSLTGKAQVTSGIGEAPKPSKYEYTLYQETPNETPQTVRMGGKFYLAVPGVAKITHNNDTLQDPALPATAFSADTFRRTQAGNYLIILRLYDQSGTQVADPAKDCWQPFTVTPQPKSFSCLRLSANPSGGNAVPFVTTLTAEATALNTTIKEYQFDFGDGNKQTVQTNQLTQSLQHTYEKGGKYTATVTVVSTENLTSSQPTCSVTINVEQQIFKKTVANNTQLTNDGKPTDANNSTAKAGDKLTYTIGIANLGADTVKSFVFEDNVSDILQYADLVDAGGAQVVNRDNQTFLVWPAIDVPVSTNSNQPTYVVKSFTVQVKDPIPTTAQKPTDGINYDCKVQDEFFGNLVITPLSINPAKQLECAVVNISGRLPQTGGAAIPIALISLFAASSVYLFFRNRLLKRELELVETLNEGEPANG